MATAVPLPERLTQIYRDCPNALYCARADQWGVGRSATRTGAPSTVCALRGRASFRRPVSGSMDATMVLRGSMRVRFGFSGGASVAPAPASALGRPPRRRVCRRHTRHPSMGPRRRPASDLVAPLGQRRGSSGAASGTSADSPPRSASNLCPACDSRLYPACA